MKPLTPSGPRSIRSAAPGVANRSSRMALTPVVIPGAARLALELTVWVLGGRGRAAAFAPWVPAAYVTALVVHHLAGTARLRWLLQR